MAAACSTLLPSGIFWAASPLGLLIASDPGRIVERLPTPPRLSDTYLRDYAQGHCPPDATPYEAVHRIPAGHTAVWDDPHAAPRVHAWVGPDHWPPPHLTGDAAVATYLEVFDDAVAELSRRTGPLVTQLSGGLDSSFVAAALARQTTVDRPVLGLIHVPLAEANLSAVGGMEPDESHLAQALARHYPGRLTIRQVRNEDLITPLDAAAESSERSWLPVFNPANQSWMTAMNRIARDAGAELLFAGGNGNAAFSFDHPYAARYYLGRGQLSTLLSLRTPDGSPTLAGVRRRVVKPVLGRSGPRPDRPDIGLPATPPPQGESARVRYLRWLTRANNGLLAAQHPAATEGILKADPFLARAVVDVAAAIEPAEWQRGGGSRSFARRLGAGRIPDEIRLRTRRGGQGWDAWYVARNDRDRYLAEAELVRDTPALGGWVDDRRLTTVINRWPWASVQGPPRAEFTAVNRLLALAAFARDAQRRLTATEGRRRL